MPVTTLTETFRSFWPKATRARSNHQSTIVAINAKAEELVAVSNDDLRFRVNQLRSLVEDGTAATSPAVLT